jgi:hypothetical protein
MKANALLLTIAVVLNGPSSCNQKINKGLGEEKGYTRAAMEKYRKDPKYFHGSNPGVLETWSRMDYVAAAVAKQNVPGTWANSADKLTFLQPQIQHDRNGMSYCVIHQSNNDVIVLLKLSSPDVCDVRIVSTLNVDRIRSGDLDFSRPDYWIYLLKASESGG